jgi:hypothetical protein
VFTVVAILVVASAGPQPVMAAGAGGQNASCNPTLVTSASLGVPVVVTDQGNVACYAPSGMPHVPYGTGPPKGNVPYPPPVGSTCSYVVYEPWTVTVNGPGSSTVTYPSPSGGPAIVEGWGGTDQLGIIPVTMVAASNVYAPMYGVGKIDAGGNCAVPANRWAVACGPGFPDPFWNAVVAGNICTHQDPNPVVGNPIPPGQIGQFFDLTKTVQQLIDPGVISAAPPTAALVNEPTCFSIQVANPALNVLQGRTYDLTIAGAPDALGRRVFYTFRIQIQAPTVTWDFGDNTTGPGGGWDPQCGPVPNNALTGVRKYAHWSQGNGFSVTAIEHYAADVTEYWYDTKAETAGPFVPNGFPLPVPVAAHQQVVLQEMGVPVA